MNIFAFISVLGALSSARAAAFYPIDNVGVSTIPSPGCDVPVTLVSTFTTTVTATPATITIALENSSSISASLAAAASIDSVYVTEQSELQPISEHPVTTTTTFVHSILVPIIEASAVTQNSSGIYYVSVGPNSTDWSYTPTQSITIGLTTVTVAPLPYNSSPLSHSESPRTTTITTRRTRITTVTKTLSPGHSFSTVGALSSSGQGQGWNSTGPHGWNSTRTTFSTEASAASGSDSVSVTQTVTTVTIRTTIGTTTVFLSSHAPEYPTSLTVSAACTITSPAGMTTSASFVTITGGYGNGNWTGSGYYTYGKRQVCTLVFATIDNEVVSWCNNWDGSSAFHESTFTSTYTPSPLPTTPSSSSSSLTTSSTTALTASSSPVSPSDTTISVSSVTTSSAAAATTSCGQSGAVNITFDSLPSFSPPNNDTAAFPPIFNPYEHFFWGNGWAYVPPPNEPFPPQAGPHLAEYIPSDSTNLTASPDAGLVPDSAFGAGPRAYDNNYWFDAESVYVGCDNGAVDLTITCDFVATGYQYDPITQQEEVVVTEHFPQPPCPKFQNCHLQQIFFSDQFTQLSSLSFYANVQGVEKIFWVDTIALRWWNNTCAAGLARASGE